MSIIDGSASRGLIRQGDLLLVPMEALPEQTWGDIHGGRLVLAEGEATGHAHVIEDSRAELRRWGATPLRGCAGGCDGVARARRARCAGGSGWGL